MNTIEQRVRELVKKVRDEGAYCCKLESVADSSESLTVKISMRCQHHSSYRFEVPYGDPVTGVQEQDDSLLMRRIAHKLVEAVSNQKR